MTEITRTVEQLVADIHVDDDGLVRIHVELPLTPNEARDAAAAIVVAAKAGDDYINEEAARAGEAVLTPPTRCYYCTGVIVPSDGVQGWKHLLGEYLTHDATVEAAGV